MSIFQQVKHLKIGFLVVLATLSLFISLSNAGEALEILKKLPPLEVPDDPPMPFIGEKWKNHPFEESGVYAGALVYTLTLTLRSLETNEPMSHLVIFAWRGMYPLIVRYGLDWKAQDIWVDFDNDNRAEEYYFNMHHYQIEYGKGKWFCESLKRFLEKY